MLLSDLFEQLASGELSQHQYGKNGTIAVANYPAVITTINRGLTALHARFPLSHKELTLQQFEGITDYKFDIKYAVSTADPSVTQRYIYDTVEDPFLDDMIRIDAAYDGEGNPVPINDEVDIRSWFTPNNDTIQIPSPTEGILVSIMYRANHKKIATTITDATTVVVDIPQSLEAALSAFVASKLFVSLGNATSIQLSAYYANQYSTELAQVERLNLLQSSQQNTNTKFIIGGWS